MSITINGAGTVTGITAGGLPDASIVTADIADANITAAKLNGAQTGTAPIYGCRAWVNFDGTRNEADTGASTNGANVKIRASGNVTSVLKNAVGDYTVTFTTAMVDANYCAVSSGATSTTFTTNPGCVEATVGAYVLAAGSCKVAAVRPPDGGEAAVPTDVVNGFVAIFR